MAFENIHTKYRAVRAVLPLADELAASLDAGIPIVDLAAGLGVSVTTIRNRLSANGYYEAKRDARRARDAEKQAGLPTSLFGALPGEWVEQGLCGQTDPELFFPEKGGSTREAKAVCAACPVAAECLDYALANNERFGIWGGLSERERRPVAKALGMPDVPVTDVTGDVA